LTNDRSLRVARVIAASCLATLLSAVVFAGVGRAAGPVSTIGVAKDDGGGKLGWHLRNTNTAGGANLHFTFGNPTTGFPIAGDWNGDKKDTIGVARPDGETKLGWYLRNANSTGGANLHFTFGSHKTAVPIVGDWNGDGIDTIGVAKDDGGGNLGWHLRNSNSTGGTHVHFTYGNPTTGFPVVGDWNGDGKDTIGVVKNDGFNHLEWNLRNTNSTGGTNLRFTFGFITDYPVVGDWNGDGKDTIGIVRDDTLGHLEWFLRNTNSNGGANTHFTYGGAGNGFPVTGDWNG
jgi:ribosomal protein S6E (S10)